MPTFPLSEVTGVPGMVIVMHQLESHASQEVIGQASWIEGESSCVHVLRNLRGVAWAQRFSQSILPFEVSLLL